MATQDLLSFAVVVALVVAVPVTMIFFGREATRRSERQWRRLGSLAGRLLQLVEGLPTLRAFGREAHGRREVAEASEGVRVATMRTLRLAFLSSLSMDLIAGLGVGLVAMVLGLRLLWGELGLQTAMAVLLVAPEVFIPLAPRRRRVPREHRRAGGGRPRPRRAGDAPPGNRRRSAEAGRAAAPVPGRCRLRVPVPVLVVSDLAVDHPGRGRPDPRGHLVRGRAGVPGGADRAVGRRQVHRPGRVALLRRAVGRHHDPRTGVGPDDVGVAAWRSRFAYLPQRPHLFHATLADNLRLGAPGAPDDELGRVLAAVGLHELVAALPDGLRDRPRARRPDAQRRRAPAGRAGPRPSQPGSRPLVGRAHRVARPPDRGPARAGRRTVARRSLGAGGRARAGPAPPLRHHGRAAARCRRPSLWWPRDGASAPARPDRSRARRGPGSPWPDCWDWASAAATIGLLAGSGYVLGRAALRPGLGAIAGILAVVEVLAFLRGPLRYEERLVGHDAALRALARWRLWLYDCLAPRVPAALAGWRSGDLLARAVDDVDAMADLYLRTVLPVTIAVAAAVLGTVAVGFVVPWAAAALGIPLAVALVVPAVLVWQRRRRGRPGGAQRGGLGAGGRRTARRGGAAGLRRRRGGAGRAGRAGPPGRRAGAAPRPPCWPAREW